MARCLRDVGHLPHRRHGRPILCRLVECASQRGEAWLDEASSVFFLLEREEGRHEHRSQCGTRRRWPHVGGASVWGRVRVSSRRLHEGPTRPPQLPVGGTRAGMMDESPLPFRLVFHYLLMGVVVIAWREVSAGITLRRRGWRGQTEVPVGLL